MNVLIIGKPQIDVTQIIDEYPIEGTTNLIKEREIMPGGISLYVAIMLANWGVKVAFARILKIEDLKYMSAHCGSLDILPLVKTSPSSFSTTPPPPLQICTNMFILCCHFSGGKCLRSAVLFYFYYVSWIYSVCLLYFSYSHYLWVLFFVSCSGRVF